MTRSFPVFALIACSALLPAASASGEEGAASGVIRFRVHTRNDRGVVRCGIFTEQGWLKQPAQAARATPGGNVAVCVFNALPKGVYGISAFHDENKNGKLDTNFIGYPIEEYCASHNARSAFSAPSFSDAKFRYSGGTAELEAQMK